MCMCLGYAGVGGVGRELGDGLDHGLEGWCYVYVSCESGLFVYVAGPGICILCWAVPVHLRCTKCSILLHLIDICFPPCICLWQISQIPTSLCVDLSLHHLIL